ncbi:MAG: Gfo/Idh/MocA family oxidoreductase [Firmicutes bacterium]|nr:Gfo/Idh/MocA family oxidoreductase [Bacillota bacterium]
MLKQSTGHMQELGVGVIGVGFMGEMHARIYQQIPGVKLMGVADENFARAREVGEKLDVAAYDNIDDLLGRDDISAVSICVSDDRHLKPAVAAARAKKHILLEKPIATDLDEGRQIIEAAKENGVLLTVGHLLRFDPRYAGLKEYQESGGIGQPVLIYTRRNSPITEGPKRYGRKGILTLHVAVHDIDLMLWYIRSKVVRVYAERAAIALKDLGIDDAVFATIKFENGAIGNLEYSWILPPASPAKIDARLEIVGTKGAGYVDLSDQGLRFVGAEGVSFPDTGHWPEFDGMIRGDLREEIMAFVDCVKSGKPPVISPEEALEAVRVALAIMQSIKEERPVNL